jgi:hypothetical protein
MTWWDFDEVSGVLELDDPALELFVQWVGGVTLAWWTNDLGEMLCHSKVGLA